MAQIKAQNVNWLDEAWRISLVIGDLPDGPPGLLSLSPGMPELPSRQRKAIEVLQDLIALHLSYRSFVVHKARIKRPDGDQMFWIGTRDPDSTKKSLKLLASLGVKFQPVDLWAYDAHMKLGRVLQDRYVCRDWKRQLPLIVASIGGQFTSQTASLKASQPRQVDRRGSLAIAVAAERKSDPHATAFEVLNRLCGGDIVKEAKDGRVFYWNAKDKLTSVGLARFETIFSEQKPSTG